MGLNTDITYEKEKEKVEVVANAKPITKREKILWLKAYHKRLFEKEGVNFPKFIPKVNYYEETVGERVVSFFPKEIYGGKDIYIELSTRNYLVEDPKRTLYKWVHNPEYETEYKKSNPHANSKDKRYLIPIDELINISELHVEPEVKEHVVKEQVELDFKDTPTGDEDAPFADMTIRDFAAIQWKKPISQRAWLNELINTNHK